MCVCARARARARARLSLRPSLSLLSTVVLTNDRYQYGVMARIKTESHYLREGREGLKVEQQIMSWLMSKFTGVLTRHLIGS